MFKVRKLDELPNGSFYYGDNFLSSPNTVLDAVMNVECKRDANIVLFGKRIKVPRRQFAVGDPGTTYSFSGTTVKAKPWNFVPELKDVRDEIHTKCGILYNFVLVNIYDTGADYIGYHSDDEKDLVPWYPIASISLGHERDFLIKRNGSAAKAFKIALKHNSLLFMGKDSQTNYKHSVPVRKKVKEPRVNLTFRRMK